MQVNLLTKEQVREWSENPVTAVFSEAIKERVTNQLQSDVLRRGEPAITHENVIEQYATMQALYDVLDFESVMRDHIMEDDQ